MMFNTSLVNEPFFIVYDSRSGSTFLANLLVKTANVAIPPESNFITDICLNYKKESIDNTQDFEEVMKLIYNDAKFSDWNIDKQEIESFINEEFPIDIRNFILSICTIYKNTNFPNANMFGLKHGSYLTHYQKIKKIFPSSKYIGIVRDGRAVFNSKKSSTYSVTGQPFETNPHRAAVEWCRIMSLLIEFKEKYPKDTLILHYEKMINNLDETTNTLCNFIGVPINASSENNQKYEIPKRYGDIHKNVKKEPISSRLTAWKQSLSAEEIYAFESVAYHYLLLAEYNLVNKQFFLKHILHNNKRLWKMLKSFKYLLKR